MRSLAWLGNGQRARRGHGRAESGDPGARRRIICVTSTAALEEAPHGYDIFRDKTDGCLKVVR